MTGPPKAIGSLSGEAAGSATGPTNNMHPDALSTTEKAHELIKSFGNSTLWRFASPAFCIGALHLPVIMYLPALYANLGMGLLTVGAIFMLSHVWDMVTDPVLGFAEDRWHTRWGRRKPMMALAVPILMISVYFAFNPPADLNAWWLLAVMLAMFVGWTLYSLAHVAWASELSGDYDERSHVMGILESATLLGAITIVAVPAVMDWLTPGQTLATKAQVMSVFIIVPMPFLLWVAFHAEPEPPALRNTRLGVVEGIVALATNAALRRLLLADLLAGIQSGVTGSLHIFFATYALQLPQLASLLIVVVYVTSFGFIPIWLRVSYRIGKHRTMVCGVLLSGVCASVALVIPPGDFWLALVMFAGMGSFIGAREMLSRSVLADVIDEDHARTGQRRNALFYAVLSMTAKLGLGLAVFMAFVALELIGFDAGGDNTPEAIEGMRLIMAGVPMVIAIAVAALMWNFPIDRTRQQQLQRDFPDETPRARPRPSA